MEEIAISEFKAKCTAIVERVRKTGRAVRITRHGQTVAVVVPPARTGDRAKWIGSLEGTMEFRGDIVSPANDENDWEAVHD